MATLIENQRICCRGCVGPTKPRSKFFVLQFPKNDHFWHLRVRKIYYRDTYSQIHKEKGILFHKCLYVNSTHAQLDRLQSAKSISRLKFCKVFYVFSVLKTLAFFSGVHSRPIGGPLEALGLTNFSSHVIYDVPESPRTPNRSPKW